MRFISMCGSMEGMSVVRSLLSESEVYIDRGDVVQASEKLYKAAE